MSRNIRREMFDYLPRYYSGSKSVTAIVTPEAAEFAALTAAQTDVLNQFYIDSATWALSRWETICGIVPDETKPYSQRRAVIKSKIRGIGTVTVALVKQVAEAYDNGQVDVVDNPASYTVTITFISTRGVPENLADIQAALREIVPAHLGINFEFNYLRWSEIDTAAKTWDQWDALALTWEQLEVYKI